MVSATSHALEGIRTVSIVDDDQRTAFFMKMYIKGLGLEPFVIEAKKPFESVQDLTRIIRDNSQAALCDHRLPYRNFAKFLGAEVVADLYDTQFPAILITQWKTVDQDVSIRKYRRKIPVLLSHDESNPEAIKSGISYCASELHGNYTAERKPHRAIVIVMKKSNESGEEVIDAFLPSWNPNEGVRFPSALIQSDLRSRVQPGTNLFAYVNIGAESSEDLYFEDERFELAPESSPYDDLN